MSGICMSFSLCSGGFGYNHLSSFSSFSSSSSQGAQYQRLDHQAWSPPQPQPLSKDRSPATAGAGSTAVMERFLDDLNLALWRRRMGIVVMSSNTFNPGTWMVCAMIVGTSVLVVCSFKDWYFVSVIMLSLDTVDNNHDSLWELDVCDLLWIYTSLISLEQWFTVDAVLISKFFAPRILGSLWPRKWIMNQWIVYADRRWATWGWHLTRDEVQPSRYLHPWWTLILTDIYSYVKSHCSAVPAVQDSWQQFHLPGYRDAQDSWDPI